MKHLDSRVRESFFPIDCAELLLQIWNEGAFCLLKFARNAWKGQNEMSRAETVSFYEVLYAKSEAKATRTPQVLTFCQQCLEVMYVFSFCVRAKGVLQKRKNECEVGR